MNIDTNEAAIMPIKHIIGALFFSLALNLFPPSAFSKGTTIEMIDLDTLDSIIMDASSVNMVVAMAAWCKPCREEMPTLEKLHRQYSQAGLSIIGLSLDSNGPKDLQPLVDKNNVTFPIYWVGKGVTKKYRIYGIPIILMIKDGEIIDKIPGQRSEKFLRKKIEELLKTD